MRKAMKSKEQQGRPKKFEAESTGKQGIARKSKEKDERSNEKQGKATKNVQGNEEKEAKSQEKE